MLKNIAVEDMEFDFISPSDSGDLSLEDDPSEKNKLRDKSNNLAKVYKSTLPISVENFENASVINGTGAGVFISTSKAKADGLSVLREDDIAIISGVGTNKTPPPPTLPFATTVIITNANQEKGKA